jgi:hypothetical protein
LIRDVHPLPPIDSSLAIQPWACCGLPVFCAYEIVIQRKNYFSLFELLVESRRVLKSKTSNAFKHGAYAHYAVLPGESEEEFQRLYSSLVGDLRQKEHQRKKSFHQLQCCIFVYGEFVKCFMTSFM